MKNITVLTILLQVLSVATCSGKAGIKTTPADHEFPSGCTVITISKGDSVFFGGNDDYINPDSYYWVDQGDSSRYGVIWIGTPDNPQQGVNEKGLAYDANGLPRIAVNPHTERLPVQGEYYHNYIIQIMHECSTVAEVIAWINTHQRLPYMHDQMHFADRTGDAVIISAGKDREIAFTRKTRGDGFLVSTNFNVANTNNSYTYPCPRYNKANEMLNRIIGQDKALTYTDLVDVMDAVHVEKPSWTIETMVADLVNGIVYIYYFYQFDKPVVLNVKNELLSPREAGPLSQLFPDDVRKEAARRFKIDNSATLIIKTLAFVWLALITLSAILLFLFCPEIKKTLKVWFPAVLIMGPVTLISGWLALKNKRQTKWSEALVETQMDLVPIVFSYTLTITLLVVSMISGKATPLFQFLMIFILPIVSGSFFHIGLLYRKSLISPRKFFMHRIAQVIITNFLGLAGICALSMPTINNNLAFPLIAPLSPLAVTGWWAIVTAGSVVGGPIIFLYEYWANRRGYAAWNTLTDNNEKATTPGWGKLWWWLLISIIILFAGLVAGVR